MSDFDLTIRGGLIVDGSGAEPFRADIGIRDGLIAAIEDDLPPAAHDIDASGLIVTPGFVDLHTHYDGQVTWEERLTPSCYHGVTTAVIGNCGVGFAPCLPERRDLLIRLMEGVEDIPYPVLAEGLPWTWTSFTDYLDVIASRRYDMDVAAFIPHAALRVHVMGERGAAREAATAEDLAEMAWLLGEALDAGALGIATSGMLMGPMTLAAKQLSPARFGMWSARRAPSSTGRATDGRSRPMARRMRRCSRWRGCCAPRARACSRSSRTSICPTGRSPPSPISRARRSVR